jgi:hypothetical protein
MILKILSKILYTFCKMLCAMLRIALLTPIAFFAWRTGQPMERPEFHVLTFYCLLSDRQAACDQLAMFIRGIPVLQRYIGYI